MVFLYFIRREELLDSRPPGESKNFLEIEVNELNGYTALAYSRFEARDIRGARPYFSRRRRLNSPYLFADIVSPAEVCF